MLRNENNTGNSDYWSSYPFKRLYVEPEIHSLCDAGSRRVSKRRGVHEEPGSRERPFSQRP